MPFLSEECCFPKVLPFLGAIAAFFVSLLTPRHLNWALFKFRGFVCACAFYLAVLQTYTCGLSDSACSGLSVSL